MAPRPELVVTLDGRVLAPGEARIRADDPLFSRGDGVFETLLLRAGVPCLLDAHLRRLAQSAALVGLPEPSVEAWRRVVGVAADVWGAADEGVLRMVHGRGRDGAAVAFATVSPLPDRVAAARRTGLAAVTLTSRIVDGPWSSVRAKSSSYAANAAALRQAALSGADDAVLVDARGVVLEGPRSSVVVVANGVLRSPSAELPILPGTTLAALFGLAQRRGIPCERSSLTVGDLVVAQGVWLLSAVTLAARVHTLDGVVLPGAATAVDVPALVATAAAGPR